MQSIQKLLNVLFGCIGGYIILREKRLHQFFNGGFLGELFPNKFSRLVDGQHSVKILAGIAHRNDHILSCDGMQQIVFLAFHFVSSFARGRMVS